MDLTTDRAHYAEPSYKYTICPPPRPSLQGSSRKATGDDRATLRKCQRYCDAAEKLSTSVFLQGVHNGTSFRYEKDQGCGSLWYRYCGVTAKLPKSAACRYAPIIESLELGITRSSAGSTAAAAASWRRHRDWSFRKMSRLVDSLKQVTTRDVRECIASKANKRKTECTDPPPWFLICPRCERLSRLPSADCQLTP
jgi:hypothetical protein